MSQEESLWGSIMVGSLSHDDIARIPAVDNPNGILLGSKVRLLVDQGPNPQMTVQDIYFDRRATIDNSAIYFAVCAWRDGGKPCKETYLLASLIML